MLLRKRIRKHLAIDLKNFICFRGEVTQLYQSRLVYI